ncbi:MAG: methylated-DNA--[protein]-cysteine S-methyltransferase [Myxococcota bacterium]
MHGASARNPVDGSDAERSAVSSSDRVWRVDRVPHPALPLLVARDANDAVVFVGFVGETGAAAASLARFATRHDARVEVDSGDSPARRQLLEYLAGTRRDFDLEVAPLGTEFQRAAWGALQEIPFGQTRSYGDQARAIGRPTAVRAIGHANGDNPIPVIIPCHRVLGADGSLTGFGGGVDVKRWLLALERNPGHPPEWKPHGKSPRRANEQLGLF